MHTTLKQPSATENMKFLSVYVGNQELGIATPVIQDVLQGLKIVPVPLAPAHVAGLLNLRGRIVAAIDVHASIGVPSPGNNHHKTYNVIVAHKDEFFSLLVDSVGEITEIAPDQIERNPDNLTERWKEVSHGIHKFNDRLLIIANIQKLIGL